MQHAPVCKPERRKPPERRVSRRGPAGRRRWRSAPLLVVAAVGTVAAAGPALAAAAPNSFAKTNLVANTATQHAKLVDPNLTNAWGIAAGPATPLWVADNT